MRPEHPQQHSAPKEMGCAGLVARLAWLVAGHLALIASILLVLKAGRPSWFDLFYALTIAFILIVRWVDITKLGGLTADGEVATLADWRRHALLLIGVGAGVRALIQVGWTVF